MNKIIKHIVVPAIMPALFFLIAATPVETLGCRTRGILAFAVALTSGMVATAAAAVGLRSRLRAGADSGRWIMSAIILTMPLVALLFLA